MFSAIVCNFLVMLYFYISYHGDYRIPMALSVTLIADYFLTYRTGYFNIGVFFFVLVQLIYGWKIGYHLWNVVLRLLLSVIFSLVIYCMGMSVDFSCLCATSISALFVNVVCAWLIYRNAGSLEEDRFLDLIFALGLSLFMACDLTVGIRNIIYTNDSVWMISEAMRYLTWVFYVPAQVLLNLTYIFSLKR